MNDEIARGPVINTRGVNANGFGAALFYQKLRRFLRKSWEMKIGYIAWFICAKVLLAITPVFAPSGEHQDDRVVGYAPETLFPCVNVLEV